MNPKMKHYQEYGYTTKNLHTMLNTFKAFEKAKNERVARMNRGTINNKDLTFLTNALKTSTVDQFLSII